MNVGVLGDKLLDAFSLMRREIGGDEGDLSALG
jgi:hypothetical protein